MLSVKTRDEAQELWQQFKATGDSRLRNRLLERYLPIVKYNADRIAARLPEGVEAHDLISAGVFGLVDALDAYDLSRGVKFETYCAPRIRGAILDELRSMDWVPRLVRSRAQRLERISRTLETELGRSPTSAELAQKLGVSERELDQLVKEATAVNQVSLSRSYFETDSNRQICEIDILEDKSVQDPLVETQRNDLKNLLTRGLTRAERLVLLLYYYEEMTMKEIGATLDLSESRVSQMHASILERLKANMSWRNPEDLNRS